MSEEQNHWYIAWKNISLSVSISGFEKTILRNVSGVVENHELVAVMGLSGTAN